MRSNCPGGPELGSGGDENKQGGQSAALNDTSNEIERGRISPMHIFKRKHHRLSSCAGHYQIGEGCQLAASQFVRCQSWRTFRRERNVEERRQQWSVLGRIKLDQRQRV